ncbi:glycoside hydrolase family 88 protein [Opitutus sp. ER46]|uniref:glycoside hydrolase family 88/105 protein n=1 Tax=Opitutus sp. ER46 TaxID=2161864 RepID=UPI000D3054F7|nr:glycoside hydrolase family 88 protein [Opitutus sp. ER46]PTX98527.1 hypothetical protein DB354_04490 [Opitutus sp. ER46]
MPTPPRLLAHLSPRSCALVFVLAAAVAAPAAEPDPVALARETVARVSRHQPAQFGPVRDGDYAAVRSVAEVRSARPPTGLGWNYSWGVTLYGVLRASETLGDPALGKWVAAHNQAVARYLAWIEPVEREAGASREWQTFIEARDVPAGGLLRLGNLDNCGAMGAQILENLLRHPQDVTPADRRLVARIAEWIVHRQERLEDGTFWRPAMTDEDKLWPLGTIWADDLYMSCPFLVRYAAFTGKPQHRTDAARQILNMAARLQDADGVWFHGYSVVRREASPFKWGRANGWAMVATVETLSALPEDHPARADLLAVFRRHAAGIARLQGESGCWRQILDRPETWEETSCTAMFAYCFARGAHRGWLPPEYRRAAERAYASIARTKVTPAGAVNGTGEGTGISLKLDYYLNRRRPDDDLHGRGAVLLAGCELIQPK